MRTVFSLRSRLSDELKEYLEEQCRDSAALAAYFPLHLRTSDANGEKTGFDGVRQKVHVRTSQRDRIVDPKEGVPVYDPIRSRPERQHLDYFGHEEREERKPVAWDDTAGDQFRRAVILGDPGYGKTWLLRFEQRRLAKEALRHLREQKKPLDEIVVPLWIRLPELAAVDQPVEKGLITKAISGDSRRSRGFGQFIGDLLSTDRCVVLLDAWDEVPKEEKKKAKCPRTALGRRLGAFVKQYPKPRILLTSRIVEFSGSPIPESGVPDAEGKTKKVAELELMAFDMGQVESVIQAWFSLWPQQKTRILELVKSNPQMRGLARIPLMLTLLCRVWQSDRESSLTSNKCELFEKCLLGLLGKWAEEDLQENRPRPNLVRLPAMVSMLQNVAFNLTDGGHQQFDASLLMEKMEKFLGALKASHPLKRDGVEKLILEFRNLGIFSTAVVRSDTSLIFLHRIFQEYLAACHLVEGINRSSGTPNAFYPYTKLKTVPFPGQLVELVRGDSKRWWEVVLLAGSELHRRSPARAWELVGALCPRECGQSGSQSPPEIDKDLQKAWLAGQILLETRLDGTTDLSEANRDIRTRVQKSLGWLLNEGRLTARERAMAGVALGRLGDLRRGVGVYGVGSPYRGLPDFDWVPIAAGVFPMGGRGGYQAGELHNSDVIKKGFKMSRYPVTVAQFRAFLEAGGYKEEGKRWWTKEGWEWRTRLCIKEPDSYRDVFQTTNHPQVGVSWYEAVAFCRWATETARENRLLKQFEEIVLPSEAEWGRVGGGLSGGTYAWGDDDTKLGERCNCHESGFGATCAVGMFPSGVSEGHLRDMTGNVQEWTRSRYRDYCFKLGAAREDLDALANRVVCGGSWLGYPVDLHVTIRNAYGPVIRSDDFGFRCVVAVVETSW